MLTIKKENMFIGVSDLRMGMENILKKIKNDPIVVKKRNRPIAVIMSKKEFDRTEKMLELAEDFVLAKIADERYKNSKDSDFVDIENVLKGL